MLNNPKILNAQLDHELGARLTRAQCLEILDAPRGASIAALAKQYRVRETLVRHVRYRCKWLRTAATRPEITF